MPMDFMAPVRRFDRYQQGRKGLAVPMAVVKKFGDDQGGNLAALMAYFAFFSLFPLLLVLTTILGFVLHGDSSAQKSVENSVLGQLPIIRQQISVHALEGSVPALVIGVVTSLLAGLGVTNAAQQALDRVWAVPFKNRANFIQARLRGLRLLVSLGLLFIVSTAAVGIVSAGFGGAGSVVLGYVVSYLVNVALFFAAYSFMTIAEVGWRELRSGTLVAALLWTILQSLGGYFVGHTLKSDSNTYGTFAFVIALLVWFHLGAQIFLYSAELNVVLQRRLWPRSLLGPPEAPADKETLTALAKVEERSDEQQVDVEFHT
jgi:membrane protein